VHRDGEGREGEEEEEEEEEVGAVFIARGVYARA